MRLIESEIEIIKHVVSGFDPDAKIRLFGSRTDDTLKGGDIDLLILSKKLTLKDKLLIRSILKENFGNRKIDIIITPKPKTAFTRMALDQSISL